MRLLIYLAVAGALITALLTACGQTNGGSSSRQPEPFPTLPAAPVITPVPELPAATELPPPTPPVAATGSPAATELPAPTALPALTPLPTAVAALPAPVLPTLTPTATPPPTPAPTATLSPPPDSSPPLVAIGEFAWTVELALTPQEQAQGLSGRAELPPGAGMLFVYDTEGRRSFWMPDMNFPLDMVWINGDCQVVDVTRDAPPQAPGQSLDDLPRYSVDNAQYILEINAGESATYGITPGAPVKFNGSLSGAYGC